jgi:hypothetical protein
VEGVKTRSLIVRGFAGPSDKLQTERETLSIFGDQAENEDVVL